MKVFLLYKDRDYDWQRPLPWNEKELTQDLELNILFSAMAGNDDFILDISRKLFFSGISNDVRTILYRHEIFKDCLENAEIISLLYDIAVGAIESRKSSWFGVFTKHPSSILSSSIGLMQIFSDILKKLKSVADENSSKFRSEGFSRLFTMLQQELTDDYFAEIRNHLDQLRFPDGVLISYELGKGNKGMHATLRKLDEEKQNWWQRLFSKKEFSHTFHLHPRDESGARILSDITDEGINLVANALAQSNDHILHFFTTLRSELAFYIGCLNLHKQLAGIQAPVCFPVPADPELKNHSFTGLYDACLALRLKQKIVGNELNADDKNLVIITGANQGGKSTFLRSVGLAQLMMQCGMMVPAESFSASLCKALFTHFKREEDVTMKSGKFDEEMSRMNDIADHIIPGSMFLFNESFAATNEREGSEIAGQIVNALLDSRFRIFFVTHLYEFAHTFYKRKLNNAVFLRAERDEKAQRTYKLKSGEPLQTSYGIDMYNKIFSSKNG
jgi:DNA mismatch repair ATPase MutS